MPTRFTEEEARRIFAVAAERQRGHDGPSTGDLTLSELQEIGRSAGLDPALVAAAAADLRHPVEARPTWHGVPLGTARTRVIPSDVTEAEWERIVDALRAEFKVSGTAEQIGRRREWTHAYHGTVAVRVRLEPVEGGTRVTVASGPAQEALAGKLLGGIFSGMALSAVGVGLLAGSLGVAVGIGGILLLAAVLQYGLAWLAARHKARAQPVRYDAVLDQIDLLGRSEDAGADPLAAGVASGSAGRIDADWLATDAPTEDAPARLQGRDRA